MLNIYINKQNSYKNKQNNFNRLSSTTNYITEKDMQIQNISERDEYKNIIFYPSSSKEWFTSIYSFNTSYIKSIISYDAVLNKLFRSYCNMLQDKIKILFKRRRTDKTRYSANKIYSSRPELNHTNTKLFITLCTYNKQKASSKWLIRKIITLIKFRKIFIKGTRKPKYTPYYKNRIFHLLKNNFFMFKKWNIAYFKPINNLVRYFLVNLRKSYLKPYNISSYSIRFLKKSIRLQKILFNTTKSINFNKYKFNNLKTNSRNIGLISLIKKLYNKNTQIQLIELNNLHLNSDVFSSAVALKLRDRQNKAVRVLRKAILQTVRIPDLHTLITFDDNVKAMNKNNIVNTIKQQIVSGVRLEASGRLTRRLTAMRSIFKYRYVGSLKNIRSSFNNKASTLLRGYVKSNSQYTVINSKTRNGTFGLKAWVSSHSFTFSLTKCFLSLLALYLSPVIYFFILLFYCLFILFIYHKTIEKLNCIDYIVNYLTGLASKSGAFLKKNTLTF